MENSSFKEQTDGDRQKNFEEKGRLELKTPLSKSRQMEIVKGICI